MGRPQAAARYTKRYPGELVPPEEKGGRFAEVFDDLRRLEMPLIVRAVLGASGFTSSMTQ